MTTTHSPTLARLLSPLKLGPIEVRNRAVVTGHGAKTVIQLFHFGAQFTSDARRSLEPLWGFSPIASPEGEMAHDMTEAEIEAVIDGCATTARIAVEAGLDGVELHATHGYLLQQSFSPWANQRTERWGDDAGRAI